ncbi:hypothetical protein CH330_00780 [candidate division WOR-3 bacterium JGI_Cruoil_03_51_56]|uniref:4Fe-4S Mo/W bis-MGD-type domain-containing protein n=1 Tax=candidate division WOR-3 bacterium JGI_Cruoil_03_51_56 TaxID=1973747 RepID=A0A235BXT1_UNCW3|nr:MAG: hypothetical protein CH330_00780 [candidate division WOR-3 bacterium JGI_Cruoil_03_51_56]
MAIKRTTCPFCRNGCEAGVSFDGYQYQMEYLKDAKVNKGKLCPRGNSANLVIDHPKRLAYPLLDGNEIIWEQAIERAKSWLESVEPDEMAVAYSRGLSAQETGLLRGFARFLGTRNLVCGHIEPESCFNYRLAGTGNATLDDIKSAQTILLIGDVFTTSPVASGPMIEACYADRKSRLVVIDSIKTRQAGFANLFLQVKPGTEPFALMALVGLLDKSVSGIDVDRFTELAGLEPDQLRQAAKMLGPGTPGFVGSAMHLGRVRYPVLHSLSSQLVALKAHKPFVGFSEARLPEGLMGFGQFRQAVDEDRIKMVFWFGGLYPYSYPELFPEMAKVEHRVCTSIFRPENTLPGLVLPVPSELEKESIGYSYWGKIERHPLASPYSGTRSVSWIIGQLARIDEIPEELSKPMGMEDVLKMATRTAEIPKDKTDNWLLVGEKKAIGIGGFYDDEQEIFVNPVAAQKLNVTDENFLAVESPSSRNEFRVHVTSAVPDGVLSIGVNAHSNRALFPIETDKESGETAMPPVSVKVEKTTATARPAPEIKAMEF